MIDLGYKTQKNWRASLNSNLAAYFIRFHLKVEGQQSSEVIFKNPGVFRSGSLVYLRQPAEQRELDFKNKYNIRTAFDLLSVS